MKILVTGASGFIGSTICKLLESTEHKTYGVSRRESGLNVSGTQEYLAADVSDRNAIERIATDIPRCDAIIHAAAEINMESYPNSLVQSNCLGVLNAQWLAELWGTTHFVFLSSIPVIGSPKVTPITEEHPTYPLTTYHSTKLFGENLVSILSKDRNCFSLRLSAPVGVGMPRNRLLSTILRKALVNEPIGLAGQGGRKQNYVDAMDIAYASLLCLSSNNSGIYNIAGLSSLSNLSLAKRCLEMCGSASDIVFTDQEDPGERVDWDISIDKAAKQLGFTPSFTIDDTIANIIAAYSGKERS